MVYDALLPQGMSQGLCHPRHQSITVCWRLTRCRQDSSNAIIEWFASLGWDSHLRMLALLLRQSTRITCVCVGRISTSRNYFDLSSYVLAFHHIRLAIMYWHYYTVNQVQHSNKVKCFPKKNKYRAGKTTFYPAMISSTACFPCPDSNPCPLVPW